MLERFKAAAAQQNAEMQDLPSENELISHYKPELIGFGNDHFVYTVEGHQNVVIKVNRESLKHAFKYCLQNDATAKDYEEDENVQQSIETWVTYYKKRAKELEEYFGKEHCLASRYVKIRIPTIPSFYKNLDLPDTSEIPSEILVLATVQEKTEAASFDENSIHAWYINDDPDVYAYTEYTTAAVTEPNTPLARPKRPNLEQEEVKVAVKDFVDSAISYTNETGQILDLNGINNVVVSNSENGELTYKLVDAMFPAHNWNNVLSEVDALIKNRIKNPTAELTKAETHKIKLVTNYIRFINELANTSGASGRLNQLTSDDTEYKNTLKKILSGLYTETKSLTV